MKVLEEPMKVLFNADDFGLTKGVTDGIIKAHLEGVVDSTTLMMNGLAVNYAITRAKQIPSLQVGIHLVLTWGKPIADNVPELIKSNGTFKYTSSFQKMKEPNLFQVEKEWEAQIQAFLQTGLPLHHIDSHHHIHGWEPLKEIVLKLANKYTVPVRYVDSLKEYPEILLTETLWLDFYRDGVDDNIFEKLRKLPYTSVEVMTHPAIIDEDLKNISSYVEKREEELAILCGLEVPSWVD